MTRINVVPVEELHVKHLVAEYREITRPFGKVRARQSKGQGPSAVKIPAAYTLGTGHETFFFNKLGFLLSRYTQLVGEMERRGYHPKPVLEESLTNGIDKVWFGNYNPTPQAVETNRQRIKERMPK